MLYAPTRPLPVNIDGSVAEAKAERAAEAGSRATVVETITIPLDEEQ